MPLPYAGFLSYRSRTDYNRARWIEGFLEGFHTKVDPSVNVDPLSISRDGSDFRLPSKRDAEEKPDGVWPIIRAELEKSECLLLLCSPGVIESPWVLREIEWFSQNRPSGSILLVVTDAEDPVAAPQQCFPRPILDLRLHETQIWYDLRGHERWQRKWNPRNWEDEIVRLASDLLSWDVAAKGPLWAVYQREQLRTRRRQATWISIAAAIGLILAAATGWYALESTRQAQHARANAIVAAAQANPDPLTSALMLLELTGDEPQSGAALARSIAAQNLAASQLLGPRSGIAALQFVDGADSIAAVSDDGTMFEWASNGVGDVRQAAKAVGDHPIGLAVANGGAVVATAVREGKALLWHPEQNFCIEISLPGMIESIAYLAALGGFVATLEDGKVFRLETDGTVRRILETAPPVVVLKTLAEGKVLIGTRNGEVWSQQGGRLTRLPGPPRAVLDDFPINGPRYAVFSPDGRWYATAFDRRILLRSLEDAKLFHSLDYAKPAARIQFSDDSSELAAGGSGGKALVWSIPDGKFSHDLDTNIRYWLTDGGGQPSGKEPEAPSIEDLKFQPRHPNRLGVLTSDGNVRLWNLAGGDPILYRGHMADHFTFSTDGRVMATGADVGTIRVWPLDSTGEPRILQHPAQVDQAYFTADGSIFSRTRDKSLHQWTESDRKHSLIYQAGSVSVLALDPGRKRVFVGLTGGSVREENTTYPVFTKAITQLTVANNRALVVAGADLALQDFFGSRKKIDLSSQQEQIESSDIRPEGDSFVTADEKGKVLLWTEQSGWASKILLPGDGVPVFEVRFHPSGRSLVTCSENGSATLFSLPSAAPQRINLPSQNKWLETCDFSPDGKWLLITSETGQAWLLDSDGSHPQLLRREAGLAHVGSILAASFSGDSSQVLLVGGVDGEATLWDVHSRKLLSVLSGHRGAVTTGSISPSGSQIMTASEDGSIRLWNNGWGDLQRRLRSLTTATLNPDQRMELLGETEVQAWKAFRTAEQIYGRSGRSSGPFLYPY